MSMPRLAVQSGMANAGCSLEFLQALEERQESLRALTDEVGGFRITDMWLTHDARPERQDESWVNMFCIAEKAE